MRLSRLLLPTLALLVSGATANNGVKNVAIIGAGAAGSSTAYHLQKYAANSDLAINVTLFEKTNHIGGRTLTVQPYGDARQPAIELGASIFVEINHILYNASRDFGLDLGDMAVLAPGDVTVIWDGDSVVFSTATGTAKWWDAVRLWWHYGLAPVRTVRLVRAVIESFLEIYKAPAFPFKSLTETVQQLGLDGITGVTAQQFLADKKINDGFANDIVQCATRVNYASNLAYIHGLESMVSMSTDGAVSVRGGNWKIFDEMVRRSNATVHRNTAVASLSSTDGKLLLTTSKQADANSSPPMSLDQYPTAFDAVVIASPWQFSNITAAEGLLSEPIESVPYTKLHVTLFATHLKICAAFVNLDSTYKVPSNVYTTLGKSEKARPGADGVGRAGFYSISTLRTVTNPKTHLAEHIYKVFSAKPITPGFLSDVFCQEISSTQAHQGPISWYYAHYFYSYPQGLPRVTFQDPIVGQGIYYTSGIESFISTMETSALMGMNVARLIADDFAAQPCVLEKHAKWTSSFYWLNDVWQLAWPGKLYDGGFGKRG
ncbi:hypothetical protein CDD82_2738 [Ophiocordyceps australis]|uniref:Prenylcysteine lyase domain-containing protein n=1 Tax=Ophiocordyceps australis TaxID=1399860 RepID=A0A2C5ZAQ9_9HYPO|nr:hypothetical protein CDD82_2738 [Ophiocordyceps australis]